jgi:hypothetical protein
MVIVASAYLRFYIAISIGVFLPTPAPPKFLPTLYPWLWLRLHSPDKNQSEVWDRVLRIGVTGQQQQLHIGFEVQ